MINWSKTKDRFGIVLDSAKSRDRVVVVCDGCGAESERILSSYKQTMKRKGRYLCSKCATSSDEFRKSCSRRALNKWQDKEYRLKNLSSVRSEAYKSSKGKQSGELWEDEEYRRSVIDGLAAAVGEGMEEKWKDPEYRAHMSDIISKRMKEKWKDDSYRRHMAEEQSRRSKKMWDDGKFEGVFQSPQFRDKMSQISKKQSGDGISEGMKRWWQDQGERIRTVMRSPDYKEAMSNSQKEQHRNRDHEQDRLARKKNFVEKSIDVHGEEYDYSEVEYVDVHTKVDIVCPIHGRFSQTPNNHTSKGNRCPRCAASLSKIQGQLADFASQFTDVIINDRTAIKPLEIDIYSPARKFGIELNGLYWHSHDRVENREERRRHAHKVDRCIENGINMMMVQEDEWLHKSDIIKSMIRNKMGASDRIYARACEVVEICSREHEEFMERSHLQGARTAALRYGLRADGNLVAVMSFSRHPSCEWEIIRFANAPGVSVVGGASRLFKRFVRIQGPSSVLSYADRRHSNGSMYVRLGFRFERVTPPNYVYVKNRKTFRRQKFQKHKLKKRLQRFNPRLTEAENMFAHGYRRLWDAGHGRYVWCATR